MKPFHAKSPAAFAIEKRQARRAFDDWSHRNDHFSGLEQFSSNTDLPIRLTPLNRSKDQVGPGWWLELLHPLADSLLRNAVHPYYCTLVASPCQM
jgi:hypothetical protein